MNQFYLFMVPISILALVIAAKIASIVLDYAPFSYPNARIMAKQGKLLSKTKFEELAEAHSLDEIVSMLKETEYTDYLSEYVGEDYTISKIERALNTHLASIYDQIYSISPNKVKPVFEVLLKRWDIENIIRTLRCIRANKDPREYLIKIGTFTDAQREQLAKAQSAEEVAMSVTTEFEHLLGSMQDEELVKIENELLFDYYSSLWEYLENTRDKNLKLLKTFFGLQIDIINIMAALRINVMEEREEVAQDFLPVTYMVSHESLKSIATADDISMVVSVLDKTPYADLFNDLVPKYEEHRNISVFEQALNDLLISHGKEISTLNPLGIGPSIGYLAQKQAEIRKLKTIIIGSYERIDPERIKEMVGVS
ncbi:ATP synthase A1 subunit C [archaeon]|nr:MAG: ATP synthase A1 subunit C [archaeon]